MRNRSHSSGFYGWEPVGGATRGLVGSLVSSDGVHQSSIAEDVVHPFVFDRVRYFFEVLHVL